MQTDRPLQSRGATIRKLRHAAGLTQEDLAHKSGLTVGTVKRLEYGYRAQRTTLRLIAEALHVDVEMLKDVA